MRQSADERIYCYHTQCPNISCEHHASHIHEFYVFRKYDYFKECQYWDLPETYYSCDSCEHIEKQWGEEPCDSCCGNHSGYVGVPSAQTETHDKHTETHACDLISRQAAIDALSTPHGILYPIRMIENMPSAQPVDEAYLIDWYINSVDDSDPVWTEAHIEELMNDFYLIPKGCIDG